MNKIPVTVLTGFLGAGKTSMIQHLLKSAAGKRIALVINEFGDLGIDGDLVRGCGCDDVVELANGCICCTVADDFIPTMEALLDRPDRPDHIVIETSGLALPKPLVKAFNWPNIRTRVTVDGVVSLVDGRAVVDGLFARDPAAVDRQRRADQNLDHESALCELFQEQLLCADVVVLNKMDLLQADEIRKLEIDLRAQCGPAVAFVRAVHGAVDPVILLGLGARAEDDLDSRPSRHDAPHDHDHDNFQSFVVEQDESATPDLLLDKLRAVVAAHPVFRVKGFAAIAGKDMRLVIQGVGGRFQSYYGQDWMDGPRTTRLVIIGAHDLDRAAILRALA